MQGRSEAHKSVVWIRGCGEMQSVSTTWGKHEEESTGKEPERRQVCLCGKWGLEGVRLRMWQLKQRNRNGPEINFRSCRLC